MENNEGNAEIMGVVLLIAIFVGAITLMGVMMLSAPQPEKVPAVAFDFWADDSHTNLSLVHRGGETLNLSGSQLKVIYSDGSSSENPAVGIDEGSAKSWSEVSASSTYGIGNSINFTTNRSVDQVQLIWPGTGGASMTGGGGPVLLGAWSTNSSSGKNPPAAVTGAVPITFPYPSEGPTRAQPTQTLAVPWVYFIADKTAVNETALGINFTNLTENQGPYGLLWDFGDGNPTPSLTKSITHNYSEPAWPSNIENYTVKLTLTDGPTQYNLSRQDYISVYKAPHALFSTSSEIERNSPFTVSFHDDSTGYVTDWLWNFGDGETSTQQYPIHEFTYISGQSPALYSVILKAIDPFESDLSDDPIIIKVHQPLIADFTESPTPGVATMPVQFTNTSTGDNITGWSWNFGDGVTSFEQNPQHTYTTAGTYNVSLNITNPWGTNTTTKSLNITSAPLAPPIANFTATPMNGTAPLTVTFTDTSTNTPTGWFWDFGDGNTSTQQNPVYIYTQLGNHNVNLTATNSAGSNTSTQQTIFVYNNLDTIRVDAGNGTYPDCLGNVWWADQVYTPGGWGYSPSGAPIYSTNAFIGNTSDPNLYQTSRWSNTGTVDYQFNVPNGNYNVQMKFAETDTSISLGNPREFDVDVNGYRVASDFNVYGTVGANSTVDLYSNVTVTENLIHVVLTGTTGPAPMIAAIGIAPASTWVSPEFTVNQTIGNAQLPIQFTEISTGNVTKRFWDFGDGSTSTQQNPTHTYVTPGTYKVMLTAGNANQSRTVVKTNYITVYQAPVAAISSNVSEGNSGMNVQFNAGNSTDYITNLAWNFGDGTTATGQNPTHTFYNNNTTPVTYTVTLNASNPWGSSITTHTVIVHQPLAPSFYANQTIGNVPFPVQFTDTSTGDNITGRNWYFGDGGTSNVQNPVYQYQYPGTYPVSLSITNIWGINTTHRLGYITVLPQLAANFTASPTIGNSPLTVQFNASTSTGVVNAYTWNFGDGTNTIGTSPIQTHTYYNNGTTSVNYIVSLTVGNQLAGTNQSPTITKTITVYPPLQAIFNATPSEWNAPVNVTFVDNSLGEAGNVSRVWTFGDGTTGSGQTPPTHIYNSQGTYVVNLTIDNGFGATSTTNRTVIVHEPLNASFTANPPAGNLPLPVQFNDTSTGYNITSWSWNFGDGTTSIVRNPTHTYQSSGNFTVTLSVSNQETKTTTRTVTVISPLRAGFSAATSGGGGLDAPRAVQFTDTSIGSPTSWSWNFGDGTAVVTTQNPIHTFTSAGTYTVTLTISNQDGSDSKSETISVIPANVHTISGIVYNDLNKQNTHPDSNEPGLAGWTVSLYEDNYGTLTPAGTTTTGADGLYMFPGLDKNKYYVVFVDLPAGWQYTTPATGSYRQKMSGNQDFPDIDFGVFQAPLSGNIILRAQKPGSLMSGGYLQFTDTVSSPGSTGITIGGQFVQVNFGDIVRIVVWNSGTGSIYIGNQISTMQLQNASVYINNMQTPVRTGQITGISIQGYNNLVSTLTVTVPLQNAQTYLKVGNVDIIPNNGGNDNRILNIYNITTTNGNNGVLNMNYGSTVAIESGYVGTCEIIA